MMDPFRIDGHKLMYHPQRVSDWLSGKTVYPIYVEVTLHGGCNHRCIFCAFDYVGYKPLILATRCAKKFITEAARRGVKAVLYAGEGEPLLHEDIAEIVAFTRRSGIDAAVATNGALLTPDMSKRLLPHLTWLRVSLDAAEAGKYASIHRARKEDFHTVIKNLKAAVSIKRKYRYACAIGVQFLLLPQNRHHVLALARALGAIGVDYLVIKPYSQHPASKNAIGKGLDYRRLFHLEGALKRLERPDFRIVFRRRAMERTAGEKQYGSCLGLPFVTYIAADGNVYPCHIFLEKKGFVLGNIYTDPFKDIWQGRRRRMVTAKIDAEWKIRRCRKACRLDAINEYLWDLKHRPAHSNFI